MEAESRTNRALRTFLLAVSSYARQTVDHDL